MVNDALNKITTDPQASARFLALLGYDKAGVEDALVAEFNIGETEARDLAESADQHAAETRRSEGLDD